MDFLDDVRPPDKPYSDVLCNTYINENIDDDLKNALEASIEFERQKQLQEFEKNKKITPTGKKNETKHSYELYIL